MRKAVSMFFCNDGLPYFFVGAAIAGTQPEVKGSTLKEITPGVIERWVDPGSEQKSQESGPFSRRCSCNKKRYV
jgi:hypothetical protein